MTSVLFYLHLNLLFSICLWTGTRLSECWTVFSRGPPCGFNFVIVVPSPALDKNVVWQRISKRSRMFWNVMLFTSLGNFLQDFLIYIFRGTSSLSRRLFLSLSVSSSGIVFILLVNGRKLSHLFFLPTNFSFQFLTMAFTFFFVSSSTWLNHVVLGYLTDASFKF